MNRKLLVLILVVSTLAFLRCNGIEEEPAELHFIVTFKDAKGLRPGQFLVYKGVRIGEITAIDLDGPNVKVSLTADENYRLQIYREAKFTIEKLSLINPTGEHQVVMSDSGDVRTPVVEATVIAGSDGWLGDVTDSLREAAASTARAAAQRLGRSEPPADPTTSSTAAD
jgi:hypothetical protein